MPDCYYINPEHWRIYMSEDVMSGTDPSTLPPVSAENLNIADILVVLEEVIGTLKTNGFIERQLDGHYNFVNPTVGEIVTEGSAIETLLKEHGLKVSPKVDKAIQSLPAFLPFLQQFFAGN